MAMDWNNPQEVMKRREAAIKAGYKPKEVDEFISTKKKEAATLQLGQQGVIDATDLAKTDPQTALKLVQQAGYKPKTSDKEKEKVAKFEDVGQNLDLLVENFGQVKSKGPVAGGISTFLSGLTGGASNPDVADYEALRQSMIGPLARTISGEVGVLTDRDISRAEKLLPKISDDPRVAEKKIENLRKLIGNQTGQPQPQPQQQAPQSQNPSIVSNQEVGLPPQPGLPTQTAQQGSQLGPINQLVYDNVAKGPVGDAAEGLLSILYPRIREATRQSATGQQVSPDQLLGAGGELAATAIPFAKGGLVAKGILSGAVHGATSPGESAVNRTGAAVGEGLLGGALGKVGEVAPKILRPFKTVGEMKQAAVAEASGKTVAGDKIYSALEKQAEKLSPTVKDGYLKFLQKSAPMLKGKDLPISQAVDLAANANDAYTQAGKVGKAASAKFNDALSKSLRGEIKTIAPKVAKANQLFGLLYGAKSGVGSTAKTAAIGAGVYALLNKLGIGQ